LLDDRKLKFERCAIVVKKKRISEKLWLNKWFKRDNDRQFRNLGAINYPIMPGSRTASTIIFPSLHLLLRVKRSEKHSTVELNFVQDKMFQLLNDEKGEKNSRQREESRAT
jgi:hypothetical protein